MLYVDYTHSTHVGQIRFHGGANYTKTILMNLVRYAASHRIAVIWPKNYSPNSDIEKKIYNSFIIITANPQKLDDIMYETNSTLYLPLIGIKEFSILKKLKQKNLNIVVTIHGLRLLDATFDRYNIMYEWTLKNKFRQFLHDVTLPIQKVAYIYTLKKYSKYIDTIITVSNYSLSRLANYICIKDIIFQYEDTLPTPHVMLQDESTEKYMLFVSGNRPEKNLARTLDAYKAYVREYDDAIPIYVVGTNDVVRCALIRSLKLEEEVKKNQIVFFDYVNDEKLGHLYSDAYFLVYTSKSEGFGLPALEAAKYGCPVVASFGTSIPEVLGPNCIYVNPYSVDSIKKGIESMIRERDFFKLKTPEVYKSVLHKIQESNEIVIRKLLSL